MARTKQKVFKELKDESTRLDKEFINIIQDYNIPPEDKDFFSDLAYSSNELYIDLTQLINNIHGMLNSTAFEMKEKEIEYQEMESRANEQRDKIQSLFQQRVKNIRNSGGYLTPAEEETLNKLTIR